jgi:hypothetical protein
VEPPDDVEVVPAPAAEAAGVAGVRPELVLAAEDGADEVLCGDPEVDPGADCVLALAEVESLADVVSSAEVGA